MARLAALLTLLALLVPAGTALAQSNPFGPLPAATPTVPPVATPAATPSTTQDTGTRTLYRIRRRAAGRVRRHRDLDRA